MSISLTTAVFRILHRGAASRSAGPSPVRRTIAVRGVIVKAVSAALILLLVRNASHEPVFAFLSIVSSYGVGLWNFAGA
ncbi:MAG: hypothetical protein ILO42_06765, partial [Clostridia bacterium]|nr:hypothetical protein [Clostridia bacterium]